MGLPEYSLPAFMITIMVTVAFNYFRFMLTPKWNQWLFVLTGLAVIISNSLLIYKQSLPLVLFIFVIISSFFFGWRGALLGTLLSAPLSLFSQPDNYLNQVVVLLPGYFAVGFITSQYARFLRQETMRQQISQNQLFRQAKELNIMRNIGTALQSTLELEKIMHIVLTAITAGHGFGFNRATLFLLSEDGNVMHGRAAIGSLRSKDVIDIWKITTREKMNLEDYIAHVHDASSANKDLIEAVHTITIPVHAEHPFTSVLQNRLSMSADLSTDVFFQQANITDIGEVAIIPLLNKGTCLGVIVVDNHVNRQKIDEDMLDRLQPLADQAAMALQNANLYRQTQELAIRDGLTGLHNQRFFEEMLQTIYNSSRNRNVPLSMLVIDIDYFKIYNDTNGHLAGNELLVQLAGILRSAVRKEDLTFRFGGEEFILLLSATQKSDALRVAEKIRKMIEDTDFPFEQYQPGGQLTVSIGVASFPDDKDHPRELFEAADIALYTAKRRGRNKVISYEESFSWSI